MNPHDTIRPTETPLESWKEIAAYVQRDSTTVRRWEKKEGLPVHRHAHQSRNSVYAYRSEIDAWRAGRKWQAEAPPPAPFWRILLKPGLILTMALFLVMAGNGLHPRVVSAQALPARPISAGPAASLGAWSFSPDGRFLASVEWIEGAGGAADELAVHDLTNGQRTMLQRGECYRNPCAQADLPVFSPDVQQLAYNWFDDRENGSQLRIIRNEAGATPRVVIRSGEYLYFEPAAWSPDGASILVALDLNGKKGQQIAWVKAGSGAVTVLKTFPNGGLKRLQLSPDGKYIAYSAPMAAGTAGREIVVLASDGRAETGVTKGAGLNDAPSWTPDGRHLLYTSDQSGNVDLWSIAMRDGKPFGVPSVVKRDIGPITAFGTTASGTFLYAVPRTDNFDSVGELRQTGGALDLQVTEKFVGTIPSWSPDGKSIAFSRVHTGQPGNDIVVRSIATGDERAYAHPGILAPVPSNWSRDGKSLIVAMRDNPRQISFDRLDLASGRFTALVPGDAFYAGFARLSPDNRDLFINARQTENTSRVDHVFAYDLKTRQRKISFASGSSRIVFWFSPDGRRIAFGTYGQDGTAHFGVTNSDAGGYREIYSVPAKEFADAILFWSADGSTLFFGKPESPRETLLLRIPAEGGQPESTGVRVPAGVKAIVPAPDGSHVALYSQEYASELWAIDNITSDLP